MTDPKADVALRTFLERYPPAPYRVLGDGFPPAQLARVGPDDGLWFLNDVPDAPPRSLPRKSLNGSGQNCHLWVIDERGRPCISEAPLSRLGEGELKHTNLTGGGEASIGGEIWFDEMPRVYLSGSSVRYPPRDEKHLQEAVALFRSVGFEVESLGWDRATNKPERVWRGAGQDRAVKG